MSAKMDFQLMVVTLALAVGGSWGDLCTQCRPTNFSLIIGSHRDFMGQWLVTVDAKRDSPSFSHRGIAVKVTQDTFSYEDGETLQLKAFAIVNSPDTEDPTKLLTDKTPVVLPTTTTEAAESGESPILNAPEGYEMVNNQGYYKFHTSAKIWEEARDECKKEGAHLMIINSVDEAEVFQKLYGMYSHAIENTGDTSVWLGFHDREVEGQHTTVLGTPLETCGYTEGWWSAGDEFDCGAASEEANLYDLECSMLLSFICEFPRYIK